jgi:hypothetical protein
MKEYLIASGFFDRQRKLILTKDYLEWESRDLKGSEFSRLNKSDIVDFKHKMDWIVWYKFTVGRQFSITFKDNRNKELKIGFNSLFGLRKENNEKYSDIVDDIWEFYHSGIVDSHLDKFYKDGQLEIQGIKLKSEGIELKGQIEVTMWDKVAIKEYYSYFAIYHKGNSNIHSRISYNEYGSETLWSILKSILSKRS